MKARSISSVPRRLLHGFTLIELLVVFTLLALLLTIAVPRYLETAENSRIKVRDQNMATIRDALDKFKADQGRFPGKLEELVEKKYLRVIPRDPVSDSTDWVVVEDATKAEAGVSDIAAPNASITGTAPASTPSDSGSEATTPLLTGEMPIPTGAQPVVGGAMPTPISKASSP